MLYSFTSFLDHWVSEGRGAGGEDYGLQQIREITSYDRKGISSYGPIMRDKMRISDILDTISNHCCIYLKKKFKNQPHEIQETLRSAKDLFTV